MTSVLSDGRPFGRSGLVVPAMGLGSAPLGNVMGEVSDTNAADVLRAVAGEPGPVLIDTAPFYGLGLAEQRIGSLLPKADKQAVILSTKVGRVLEKHGGTVEARFDFSYDGVMRSFEESLKRLDVDRIDIAHIHDPDDHFREALDGAFTALTRLKDSGAVKAISAGMNQWEMLSRFLDHAPFDGFLLAGRYSLLDRAAGASFLPKCAEQGVGLIVGGVFNSGILADPRANHSFNYAQASAGIIEQALALDAVCRRHGVPLKAAALQFPLRHKAVSGIVIGVSSRREWQENKELLGLEIADELWADLDRAVDESRERLL